MFYLYLLEVILFDSAPPPPRVVECLDDETIPVEKPPASLVFDVVVVGIICLWWGVPLGLTIGVEYGVSS